MSRSRKAKTHQENAYGKKGLVINIYFYYSPQKRDMTQVFRHMSIFVTFLLFAHYDIYNITHTLLFRLAPPVFAPHVY